MTDKIYYVYLHRRNDNGDPFYVGKGKDKRAWVTRGKNYIWKRIAKISGYTVDIIFRTSVEDCAFSIEMATIKRLKHLGYELANLTNGGEGCSGIGKKVYSSLGEEFKTVAEAALYLRGQGYLKASGSQISTCCNEGRGTSYGRAWSYECTPDHPEFTGLDAIADACRRNYSKKVYCSDGMVFNSASEAARYLSEKGNKQASQGLISRSCRDINLTAYGRKWSYHSQPSPPLLSGMESTIAASVASKSRPVGNDLGEAYDSLAKAEEWLRDNGFPKASRSAICLSAKSGTRKSYKRMWHYK